MALPTTVEEALLQTALGPEEMEKNGHRVKQQDLDALMRLADRDAALASAVSNRPGLGIRIQAIRPYYP